MTGYLKACLDEVRDGMRSDLLVLNKEKNEVVLFSSRLKSDVDKLDGLRIGESNVIPSSSVRNLGVI